MARTHPLSTLAWLITAMVLGFLALKEPSYPLTWDVFGYYLYLPSTFIYHDPGLTDFDTIRQLIDKYSLTETFYQGYQTEQGTWVNKYSMGMAVLYSPAFLMADFLASSLSHQADGFSPPYGYAISLWSFFFTLLGTWFTLKILKRYLSDRISAITLLLLVFGTNYFHIAVYTPAMPHNYLFALYALIVWLTIRWHDQGRRTHLILLAITCGLNILARPSEIICLLIPLFWGSSSWKEARLKIAGLIKQKKDILLFAFIVILTGMPQMLYWKAVSGKLLFYSYNNPGEGFDFFTPYILEILFSFRKGWLIYTPLMILALAGIIIAVKKKFSCGWTIALFTILNIYIVGSWSTWWYADSFSQRALVQSYPVLALPFGIALNSIANKRLRFRITAGIAILLLAGLNLFQTWQMQHGILHSSRMTAAYYFATFGSLEKKPELENLLLVNRPYSGKEKIPEGASFSKRTLAFNAFDGEGTDAKYMEGNPAGFVNAEKPFLVAAEIPYREITDGEYAWIRAGARIYSPVPLSENLSSLVITFEHKGGAYKYLAEDLHSICPDSAGWCTVSMDYMTPEVRSVNDVLKVYIWYRSDKELLVDDFRVEAFVPEE